MRMLVASIILLASSNSMCHLAHHWHDGTMGMGAITLANGGAIARFTHSGLNCVVTDPIGGHAADTITGAGANPGLAVCRLATKYRTGAGCSIGANNMYTCTGDVALGSCAIDSSGQFSTCN